MKLFSFFDRLEDKTRHALSRHPVPYALIGGVSIVLFWRAVWELADLAPHIHPGWWLVGSVIIMLLTGTFVSFFIGENIIISGLKADKRIDEKTEIDLREEDEYIKHLYDLVHEVRNDIKEIKSKLNQ
ncbi:MAG: hypothetical protein A2735_01860 [Candidatus Yanofskybacteria bacterium RIFCSPHIGHO2_01_FULL_41_21]|uniref:Uncharacterized protein n=1 Tax=Candidatus Yanofskybacteria bacterium RIFCSPHIGHO2_01_FULL_41_21 TaxID=1802660 RepID=A0A1F8EA08_9BACT|nr:MAG: hypothetical protein A2735_01860 [Candidatus Yanofskybacteria bacterium RIFCSPHIGHO2_01_FULL_41_21]